MHDLLQLLKRPLGHIAALSIALNLLLLAPTLFMMQVFDRVLVSQSQDTLLVLAVGTVIALVMVVALDYLRSRLQGVVGNLLGDLLLPPVVREVLHRSTRLGGSRPQDAVRDVAALRQLFSAQGLLALFDAPWLFVYVALIAWIHPLLGLTAGLATVAMVGLALLNDRLTRRDIASLQQQASVATNYLEHALRRAEILQSLGMSNAMLARWIDKNAAISQLQHTTAICSTAMSAASRTLRHLMQMGMLAVGAYLVITQRGTPGIMIATTVLIGRALAPVEQIVSSWRVLAEGHNAWSRLSKLLGSSAASPTPMPLPPPAGELVASGVSLRLPGTDRLLLSSVSLELRPGEALAIIGSSAAGKSSLLRMLVGLWSPSAGVVRLDGADISQWPRQELGRWIGYLPQDVELFAGSVAENIARLGEVDAERVAFAAKRARVHELILSLPQGYDTVLDDGGHPLSPGQRQRIALARALYGDVRLLILDEPNANLDGAGEQALGDALRDLHGEVTVIVVTHRSTLIQHVDKVLVMEAGRVRHYGYRDEVLTRMQNPAGVVVPLPRATAMRHTPSSVVPRSTKSS